MISWGAILVVGVVLMVVIVWALSPGSSGKERE